MSLVVRVCSFTCMLVCTGAVALETIEWDQASHLSCAQNISDCRVKDGEDPRQGSDPIQITGLDLKALLCCRQGRDCRPCLELYITLTGPCGKVEGSGDGSEDYGSTVSEKPSRRPGGEASLTPRLSELSFVVCYTTASTITVCKVLEFTLHPAEAEDRGESEVWLSLVVSDKLAFGSQVFVFAQSVHRSIVLPSEQKVCSTVHKEIIRECNVPRLRTVIDWMKGEARLYLDNKDEHDSTPAGLCLKYEDTGDCLYQQWDHKANVSIPLHSVTPCLCVQVWWMKPDALRVNSHPFNNYTEFVNNIWKNVSLSVAAVQTNENDMVLAWNLSAPCRVEAELWLCEMRFEGARSRCEEMWGSRVRLRKDEDSEWSITSKGHLGKGEFINIIPHPTLCVAAKVEGMGHELNTCCPVSGPRRSWTLLVCLSVTLICLLIVVVHVLYGSIKGVAEQGHVILLHPPDMEPALPDLLCWLGSMLSAAGFSVSGDLWSRTELCTLGPMPWLHKQLERLQMQGGKAVLVLTQAAWEQAEDWQEAVGTRRISCSPYSDVFVAALSCILADHLQGQAGRRFILVQFDSLAPWPSGSCHPLPELFQGLSLYSLPSQRVEFLMELAGSCRWARWWLGRLWVRLWVSAPGVDRVGGLVRHQVSRSMPGRPWERTLLQPVTRP